MPELIIVVLDNAIAVLANAEWVGARGEGRAEGNLAPTPSGKAPAAKDVDLGAGELRIEACW